MGRRMFTCVCHLSCKLFVPYVATKIWDKKKQKYYICPKVIFNESDFVSSSETSDQEPEGTEEPWNNVQIVENHEEREQ